MPRIPWKQLILLVLITGLAACTYSTGKIPGADESSPAADGPEVTDDTNENVTGGGSATQFTFFIDADGDGYGDPNKGTTDSEKPEGYVDNSDDCDDTKDSVHPGARDPSKDGIDQNCDGILRYIPAEERRYGGDFTSPLDGSMASQYDADQKEIVLSRYDGDIGSPDKSTYTKTFNDQGKLIRAKKVSPDTTRPISYVEYSYDDQGRRIEIHGYSDPAAADHTKRISYTYDDKGNVISIKEVRGDPSAPPVEIQSAQYTYNDAGQKILFKYYDGDFDSDPIDHVEIHSYDDGGKIAVRHDGAEDGPVAWSYRGTHDEHNRPQTLKFYSGDLTMPGTPVELSVKLFYDGNGNLIARESYKGDFEDASSLLKIKYEMSYDERGNRRSLNQLSGDPLEIKSSFTWTYDENNNPLTQELTTPAVLPEPDSTERYPFPRPIKRPKGSILYSGYIPLPFDIMPVEKIMVIRMLP